MAIDPSGHGSAPKVLVFDNGEALAQVAAEMIGNAMRQAVHERGRFLLALSGGGSPGRTYELLASAEYDRLPWQAVHLLWVDERAVPPDHEASNFRLVQSFGLLRRDLAGIHRMAGEAAPEEAAADYERVLRGLAAAAPEQTARAQQAGRPLVIDLCIMGMGDDGHTASLFPGAPELEEHERWVAATKGVHAGHRRLTLTPPILAASGRLLYLVTGEAKAEPLKQVLSGENRGLPTARVLAQARSATMLIDRPAATLLDREPLPR